jgi:agmatinase
MCYELGIKEVVKQIKEKFDDRYAIYLSYDIDINDPSQAPGTGTPEAFGLSSRMVLELVLSLFNELPIKAFDIVEVSPNLDCNDITTWLALKTLYEVFKVLMDKENL